MQSIKEDERFIRLIGEMIKIDEELGHAVIAVDKKELLEKRNKELHDQYMSCIIELDRIRIRETPYIKEMANLFRDILGYGPRNIDDFWHDYCQEILDYHQDGELIDRGSFARRYFQLVPPYVKTGTVIPEGIKDIYHESRWCFVYGQYNASLALCRTIVETVLRTKYNLPEDLNIKGLIITAKERGLISGKTKWNTNKVRLFANEILHKAKPISEKEAKDAIDYTLFFLEEIYF